MMKSVLRLICAVLALALCLSAFASCGEEAEVKDWCSYLETRDVSGRDISYAKITVAEYGDIIVLLDATTAPTTVENFKKLVNKGFYDGLTFHRVIENFMIQGGCPNGDGTGDAGKKIYGEFDENGHKNDIKHIEGVISMARGDSKNSASCQFFICNADYPSLDGKYAAFGYVVEGMSVVHKITKKTAKYGDSNGAIEEKHRQAIITSITLLDNYTPKA